MTIRDLGVGSHVVTGELRHYQAAEKSARVDAGKTTSVTLTLVPAPGRLSVTSTPAGAAVSLDGNSVGTTPWSGSVSPGVNHEVVVSKKGFVSEKRSARIEPDGDQPVNADLRSEVVELPGRISGADSAQMVLVRAGEFLMGSASSDSQASDDERPQHRVSLKAFYIDRYEVTNGQYGAFLKSVRDGSHRSCDSSEPSGRDHTPDTATWNDAE